MFGLPWHVRFQHLHGGNGKKEYTRVCDVALAEEFLRKVDDEGHVILVQGMEFLKKGWNHFPNINDVNSTNVSMEKVLRQNLNLRLRFCLVGSHKRNVFILIKLILFIIGCVW
jgi:hypothetical protein